MKTHSHTAPVLFLLASSLGAQTSESARVGHPQHFRLGAVRAVAGRSTSLELPVDRSAIGSVSSINVSPPLRFPPHVHVDRTGSNTSLRITVLPGTPRGVYELEVVGKAAGGGPSIADIDITVDSVTLPKPMNGRHPVILLNGFQPICNPARSDSTVEDSVDTFGQLTSLLLVAGAPVAFFNNCAYGNVSIEDLASELGNFISELTYIDGTPLTQPIDLIAHSMGGLIARAYLTGLKPNGSFSPQNRDFNPPSISSPLIRKLIFIATPHFGSFQAYKASPFKTQAQELTPGSSFLWQLNTWNQYTDDLRGVDALAIIGNAGAHYDSATGGTFDDGVVSLSSGSLTFSRTDERTRVVPYCHVTPNLITPIAMDCTGHQGIADIDSPDHQSWLIINSFLLDTSFWKALGAPPSQNQWLSQYGGMYFGLVDAQASQYISDISQVLFGGVQLSSGGAANSIFYSEFIRGTGGFQVSSHSLGVLNCGSSIAVLLGSYNTYRCKSGPTLSSVQPTVPGTSAIMVPSGATITLQGVGLGQQCSTCTVVAYPAALPLTVASGAWSDQAITAKLPASLGGFVQLVVTSTGGKDSINIMIAPAATVSSVVVTSVASAASGATGPVAPGEIITIKGSGLGPVNGVAMPTGSPGSLIASTLAGTQVLFGSFAAPIIYASATQVNAIVPYEVAGLSQTSMQVSFQGAGSVGTTLSVVSSAAGLFTFNATGVGQAMAANQDGSLNGSSSPAAPGSYVTIYFTGGGQTTPPGVTGSITGSVLKPLSQNVIVTVGGIPAIVGFAGAAPNSADGFLQLNIQLANGTPSGPSEPVVLTIGGLSSPDTATIAVAAPIGFSLNSKSFSMSGTLTISGKSVAFEVQALVNADGSYALFVDDDMAISSPIQFVFQFSSRTTNPSGMTIGFSGLASTGLYADFSDPSNPVSKPITAASMLITFTSLSNGAQVSGGLVIGFASGQINGTFTGTLGIVF